MVCNLSVAAPPTGPELANDEWRRMSKRRSVFPSRKRDGMHKSDIDLIDFSVAYVEIYSVCFSYVFNDITIRKYSRLLN